MTGKTRKMTKNSILGLIEKRHYHNYSYHFATRMKTHHINVYFPAF